jgi:hypothetical protein
MKEKILFAFAIFLLFSIFVPRTFAQSSFQVCSDNSTLTHFRFIQIYVGNSLTNFNVTENETCNNGCQQNACISPPYIVYGLIFGLLLVGGIIVTLFIRRDQ